MATSERTSPRDSAGTRIAVWLGLTLVGLAIAIALFWRFELLAPSDATTSARGAGSGSAAELSALPLPDDSYVGTVVDPADFASGTVVSADEALKAARANQPNLVGSSPLLRLMQISKDGPDASERLNGVYWVILSADAWVPMTGPLGFVPPEYTTYGWVLVDTEGVVVLTAANSYVHGDPPPPDLPDR